MPTVDVSDTGQGATIAFSSTTFAARIEYIRIGDQTIEDLDDSVLSSTGFKEYISGDLVEPGGVTYGIMFPTSLTLPTVGGTPETATITFPLRSGAGGEDTAASIAGSGYFKKLGGTELRLGTIQKAEIEFKFDGKTGPTFTASAAT
jgi:hypothetical protein